MTRRDEPPRDRHAELALPVDRRLVVAAVAGFAAVSLAVGYLVAPQVPPDAGATPEATGVVLGATAAPQFATALPALEPSPSLVVITPRGSATASPSPTASPTPTAGPARGSTGTATPARPATPSPTPTSTATPSPSPTRTATPSPTPTPTATPSPTPTRTATPSPAPTRSATPSVAASPAIGARTYTVVAGDTLWGIAERFYGDGTKWPRIHDANRGAIGNDPALIRVGTTLAIPPP